jgi:HSP20 family protein
VSQLLFTQSDESRELAEDIRELFDDLARTLDRTRRAFSGEYHPSLDVLETETAVEVVVDVSGIPPDALRVLFRSGVLVVAGEKAPAPASGDQTFHLVEREFGRFARAVRLNGALDVSQARASVRDGELTVVLPKIAERRGQGHRIRVGSAAGPNP